MDTSSWQFYQKKAKSLENRFYTIIYENNDLDFPLGTNNSSIELTRN
jgi:hypothetical protein